MDIPKKAIDLFWSRVNKKDPDDCWFWTGATNRKNGGGYGSISWAESRGGCYQERVTYLAHRVSYEIHKGPIPEDLELSHLCRTPLCVNPKHLVATTAQENKLYSRSSILSKEDVKTIRKLYAAGGVLQRELGVRFGVSRPTISAIVTKTNWKDI